MRVIASGVLGQQCSVLLGVGGASKSYVRLHRDSGLSAADGDRFGGPYLGSGLRILRFTSSC